jgi:hypothetical protein
MNTSSGLGATLTVTDSTVAGNCAQLVGGGILNGRTMTVSGSTVCGNSADLGGGIFADGGASESCAVWSSEIHEPPASRREARGA